MVRAFVDEFRQKIFHLRKKSFSELKNDKVPNEELRNYVTALDVSFRIPGSRRKARPKAKNQIRETRAIRDTLPRLPHAASFFALLRAAGAWFTYSA